MHTLQLLILLLTESPKFVEPWYLPAADDCVPVAECESLYFWILYPLASTPGFREAASVGPSSYSTLCLLLLISDMMALSTMLLFSLALLSNSFCNFLSAACKQLSHGAPKSFLRMVGEKNT